MKFVKYARVATKDKSRNIVSLEEQAKLLKQYSKKSNAKQEVVIYGRANNAVALDEQMNLIRSLAQKDNLNVVEIFLENGYAWPIYPVFNKMLKKIKSLKIDGVLIFSYDRLPRVTSLRLELCNLLEAKNIELISVVEDPNLLAFKSAMDAGFTALERQLISHRIRAGIKQSKKNSN